MKFSTILLPTAFLLPYVLAFPSYAGLEDRSGNLEKRQQQFDPVRQKIDITGNHIFKAPGVNDLRGPCPGLNALANHGYIQRSGVTSLLEVLSAAQTVFGFAVDLAIGLGYARSFPSLPPRDSFCSLFFSVGIVLLVSFLLEIPSARNSLLVGRPHSHR